MRKLKLLSIVATVTKYLGLLILAFVIIGALIIGYAWYDNLNPQGEANSHCDKEELPSVQSGAGMVVTAHNTVCSYGFAGNSSSAIYVYVHKVGEAEGEHTLVFRYLDKNDVAPPKFEWTSSNSLRISVAEVSEVTKQLSNVEGVTISYAIGAEE